MVSLRRTGPVGAPLMHAISIRAALWYADMLGVAALIRQIGQLPAKTSGEATQLMRADNRKETAPS